MCSEYRPMIENGYLLGFDILKKLKLAENNFTSQVDTDIPDNFKTDHGVVRFCNTYGFPLSGKSFTKLYEGLPKIFNSDVDSVYLFNHIIKQYEIRICTIPLSAIQAKRIIHYKGGKTIECVNLAIENFLSPKPNVRVWPPDGGFTMFGWVLFFPINASYWDEFNKAGGYENLSDFANKIREELLKTGYPKVSSFMSDLLLFSGPVALKEDVFLTAVWLPPFHKDDRKTQIISEIGHNIYIYLPKTLFDLIEFMSMLHIIEDLKNSIISLPLGKQNVKTYIEKLLLSREKFIDAYLGEYLEDQEKSLNLILASDDIIDHINTIGKNNYVNMNEYIERTHLFDKSEDSPSKIRSLLFEFDLLEVLYKRKNDAINDYNKAKRTVLHRGETLKGYFRARLSQR